MEPRTALNLWRWPLAVILGLATMCFAVVMAWIANRELIALPHWARSGGLLVGLAAMAIACFVRASRQRRTQRRGLRPVGTDILP